MKSSIKHNSKTMKSLDSKQTHKLKNAKKNILREIESLKEKDEISLLSNANLNIIKILNSCANEDILNESSSFIVSNSNDDIKERSLESINKWKKRVCQFKPSPMQKYKKRIQRKPNSKSSNLSNFQLNSNISDFSSESRFSDKKHNNINSPKKSNFRPHNNDKDGSIDEIPSKPNLIKPTQRHKSDINTVKFKNRVKKPIVRHKNDINMTKRLRNSSKKFDNYISDVGLNSVLNNSKKNKRRDSSDVEIDINNCGKKKKPDERHSIEFNHKRKEHFSPRKRSRSIVFNDKIILSNNLKNVPNPNIASEKEMENNENYKGFLNEIEIISVEKKIKIQYIIFK